MKSLLFTTDSGTTVEDSRTPVVEYYKGSFEVVHSMYREFESHGEVTALVYSDTHGLMRGETEFSEVEASESDTEEVIAALVAEVSEADVVGVFLPKSEFKRFIVPNWERLVSSAKPDSVWCIGASSTALNQVDVGMLEARDCKVVLYHRKGVARIGKTPKEEFLSEVLELTEV